MFEREILRLMPSAFVLAVMGGQQAKRGSFAAVRQDVFCNTTERNYHKMPAVHFSAVVFALCLYITAHVKN